MVELHLCKTHDANYSLRKLDDAVPVLLSDGLHSSSFAALAISKVCSGLFPGRNLQ